MCAALRLYLLGQVHFLKWYHARREYVFLLTQNRNETLLSVTYLLFTLAYREGVLIEFVTKKSNENVLHVKNGDYFKLHLKARAISLN